MSPAEAANPALGVLIFAIGGLAGAVFYLPFRKVRHWAWESYWLIYAVTGLLIVPLVLTLIVFPRSCCPARTWKDPSLGRGRRADVVGRRG